MPWKILTSEILEALYTVFILLSGLSFLQP